MAFIVSILEIEEKDAKAMLRNKGIPILESYFEEKREDTREIKETYMENRLKWRRPGPRYN